MKQKLLIITVLAIAVLAVGAVWLRAAPPVAAPTVGTLTATPNLNTVNVPTTVTFTIPITDPTLLPGGVNLLRLGATGTQPTILGIMHDDGLNGDLVQGDKVFTSVLNLNESQVGTISLQASVAFRGQIRRTLSAPTALAIWNQFQDAQSGLELNIPPGLSGDSRASSRGGEEIILVNANPASPDLAVAFAIQVFTVSPSTLTIQDVVVQRINPIGILSSSELNGGLLVESDTLWHYHFFQYHPITGKAIEVYGADVDFLQSENFSKMVSSMRY